MHFRAVDRSFGADLVRDLAIHAEDGGDRLFRQDQDLQHEVSPFICAPGHAGLPHENGLASRIASMATIVPSSENGERSK